MDPYSNLPGKAPKSETPEAGIPDPNTAGPKHSVLMVIASWLVIILLVCGIAISVSYFQFFQPKRLETSSSELLGVNITAKMILGYQDSSALEQAEQFNIGPLEQRYGYTILVNELSGPTNALSKLEQIDQAVHDEQDARRKVGNDVEFPTEAQIEIRRVLGDLFEQYENGNFDSSGFAEADQELLEKKLGWVSNLALTPKNSPDQTTRQEMVNTGKGLFRILVTGMLIGLFALVASFAACFICFGMLVTSQVEPKFQNRSQHGFVYIETFAIWIVVFFGAQYLAAWIASLMQSTTLSMTLSPVAFFGSLIALVWPMIRGVPFRTVRKDIGWELGNPFVETALGGFSYLAMILPMLFGISVSVLIGIGLSFLVSLENFESAGPVGHPIAEEIASGGPYAWIPIALAACVAAPIVEETMFRGVLYRYLRDATNTNQARWVSVALSSLFGGLIFAMIHPQGLIGIPILTTLAIGFSLVREWRNSLIGPMVMHAVNNSIVTCMLILVA